MRNFPNSLANVEKILLADLLDIGPANGHIDAIQRRKATSEANP